jgi:hypothetical protein
MVRHENLRRGKGRERVGLNMGRPMIEHTTLTRQGGRGGGLVRAHIRGRSSFRSLPWFRQSSCGRGCAARGRSLSRGWAHTARVRLLLAYQQHVCRAMHT